MRRGAAMAMAPASYRNTDHGIDDNDHLW